MFSGRDFDTICAVSSPPGTGGVILIRVSGKDSLRLSRLFLKKLPSIIESHRAYLDIFLNPKTNHSIDEVVILYFKEGKSFTGEEVVEISCHGNPLISEHILQCYILQGARAADRGEFTYRAFLNGRIDLVQAESVLSLIEGESQRASRLALSQLKGGISKELEAVEEEILSVLAHCEADIDFATEGLETLSQSAALERLNPTLLSLKALAMSYETGRRVYSGCKVSLVGLPNVGKSSLLNNLLMDEKAIVSAIPGTTRDVVEDKLALNGIMVSFMDTAGIRATDDEVEKIGISRSFRAIDESDLILVIFDASKPNLRALFSEFEVRGFSFIDNLQRIVFVGNKSDLVTDSDRVKGLILSEIGEISTEIPGKMFKNRVEMIEFIKSRMVFCTSFSKVARSDLLVIVNSILAPETGGEELLLSRSRHYEGVLKAIDALSRGVDLLKGNEGREFIALELKEALVSIQTVVGKKYDEDVLKRIFSEFCVGK